MPELLTESFCERCGTRYTFESNAPRAGRIGRFKTLSAGLKNYVLSDEASLDEALADARGDGDRRASSEQLDAFHKTFNFCMSCRQYTCANCWNEPEGRCLTCAPHLGREILPAPFPTLEPTVGLIGTAPATNGNGNGHSTDHGESGPVTIDATSWPTVDLRDGSVSSNEAGTYDALDDESGTAPISRLEALFGVAPKPREPEPPTAGEPAAEASIGDPAIDETSADLSGPIALSALLGAAAITAQPESAPEPEFAAEPEIAASLAPAETDRPSPTALPSERDELFPAHSEPAYSIEPEPLFPAHQEQAYTIESESLFPTQPAGWPASASTPGAPPAPVSQPPLAPAASAAPPADVVQPVVVQPVVAAGAPLAPAPAPSPATDAPEPATIAPSTDERAAAAATNTTVLLRRFRASRPATDPTTPALGVAGESAELAPAAAAAAAAGAAAAAALPAEAPAPPARPAVDTVETPVWRMVAPETAPPPAVAPAVAAPKINGHDQSAEPQWPATPAWPATASGPSRNPVSGVDAIWAQSSKDVLKRPEAGVQACLNCGLPLSSTARFCRRCGTSQVSA